MREAECELTGNMKRCSVTPAAAPAIMALPIDMPSAEDEGVSKMVQVLTQCVSDMLHARMRACVT
jgi:hypothetical protein